MASSDDFNALHQQTEQNRLDSLRTDLNLIHTLTDLVESELKLKSREHAVQTFARVPLAAPEADADCVVPSEG